MFVRTVDTPPRAPDADGVVSRRLGEYELISPIGSGGMAEVWYGRMIGYGGAQKAVAIKLLKRSLTDPKYKQMFFDEVRLSMLLSHSNIVSTFDVGLEQDEPYLVMEWIDGVDLAHLLAAQRKLDRPVPLVVAAYVADELLTGLAYAHQLVHEGRHLGIAHRDVSPQNVLVSQMGEIKLTDFGVAHMQAEETSGHHVKGKLRYMAREHLAGQSKGPTIDLFAAGAILHELLENKKFRDGLDEVALYREILGGERPPALTRPDVPDELRRVHDWLLAPEEKDRCPSAEEALELLRAWPGHRKSNIKLAKLCREIMGVAGPRSSRASGPVSESGLRGPGASHSGSVAPSSAQAPSAPIAVAQAPSGPHGTRLGSPAAPPRPSDVETVPGLGANQENAGELGAIAFAPTQTHKRSADSIPAMTSETEPARLPDVAAPRGRSTLALLGAAVGVAVLGFGVAVGGFMAFRGDFGDAADDAAADDAVAQVDAVEPATAAQPGAQVDPPTETPKPTAVDGAPSPAEPTTPEPTTAVPEPPAPDTKATAEPKPAAPTKSTPAKSAPRKSSPPAAKTPAPETKKTARPSKPPPKQLPPVVVHLRLGGGLDKAFVKVAGQTKTLAPKSAIKLVPTRHTVKWRISESGSWKSKRLSIADERNQIIRIYPTGPKLEHE